VIPSELISAAQVFKTTTAAQTDGSIGGLVNIQTASALANPGFHVAASAAAQLESLNDEVGFKGALVASNTFANDTIGIIGSISFQERDFRTDTAESIAIDSGNDCRSGVCETATIPNPAFVSQAATPNEPTTLGPNPAFVGGTRLNSFNANVNNESRERLGATLAVEYEPNDSTSVTVDFLYTSFESPSLSSSYSYFPNPGVVSNAVVDANNDVISQTSNFTDGAPFSNIFDFVARRAEADTETFQIGGNWEQRFGDKIRTELDVSYSNADGVRDNIGSDAGSGSFFVVSFPGANFTQTPGGRVPNISFTALPTIDAATPVSIDQLPAEGARLHFSRNSSNEVEDEVFTIRGDLDWEFSDNATFRTGFDFITREKTSRVFDNSATQCGDAGIDLPTLGTGLSDPDGEPQNAFFCDRSILFSDLLTPDQLSTLLSPFNGEAEGFLDSTNADIPRNFQIVNIETVEQAFEALAGFTGVPSFLTPTLNEANSNTVEEDVISAYIQADWEGTLGSIPYTANAGVRVAYTDTTSIGAVASLESVVIDTVSGNNNITFGAPVAVEENNDYFDVLPSFNIAFDLQENLKLRGGFSRSIARPTFEDLSTVFAVTQINAGQEQTAGGNPQLEAVRSNNLDVSLEWYGDNGLSLSAAGFYKDIDDFIQNANSDLLITIPASTSLANEQLGPQDVNFQNSSPTNSDSAEVFGLELAGQYLFGSQFGVFEGFGVSTNITLAESNSTLDGVSARLENISDFSANASIFYENYGFQGRISLNHRGDFLGETDGEGGFNNIVDDFTQVDLQVAYNVGQFIDRDISVFVEGINITNEQFFVFSERESFLESFIDNGSRWLFGVRASF